MTKSFINSELEIKRLGENIRLARKRRKMTSSELEAKSAVSRKTISRIEAGDITVGIGNVFNVLNALGLLKGLAEMADPEMDRAQAMKEIWSLRDKSTGKFNSTIVGRKVSPDEIDF